MSAALDAVKEHFKVPWKETASVKVLEVLTPDQSSPSKEDAAVEPPTPEALIPVVETASGREQALTGADGSTESPKEAEPHKRVLHTHNFEKALMLKGRVR